MDKALRDRILKLRQCLNANCVPESNRLLILSSDHGLETGDMVFGFIVVTPNHLDVIRKEHRFFVLP